MIAQIKVQARIPFISSGILLFVLEAWSGAEAQFAVRPELIAGFQMDHIVYEKIRAEITTGIGLIIIVIETGVVLIVMIYLVYCQS